MGVDRRAEKEVLCSKGDLRGWPAALERGPRGNMAVGIVTRVSTRNVLRIRQLQTSERSSRLAGSAGAGCPRKDGGRDRDADKDAHCIANQEAAD